MEFKKILIGTNAFYPNWIVSIKKINQPNIIIQDFSIDIIKTIKDYGVDYILPLSDKDYNILKNTNGIDEYNSIILYPSISNIELLGNKLNFTKFMLEYFPEYIPKVYYLENIKLEENIEYPVISKPIYSTNGTNMSILNNEKKLNTQSNKIIIQKYIELIYEYSAFFLSIDGKIINVKIIKKAYPKYHIKKTNFVNYEEVKNFPIEILEKITNKINYTGGGCIDYKFDDKIKQIYIFEFNPRFGGSAFTNNFIYELLCVKN